MVHVLIYVTFSIVIGFFDKYDGTTQKHMELPKGVQTTKTTTEEQKTTHVNPKSENHQHKK